MDYLLNLELELVDNDVATEVLNLIINGLPSKLNLRLAKIFIPPTSFKPYYKWITF